MSTRHPRLLESSSTDLSLQLTFRLQSELIYFDGHFPEQAILPGVTQLFWAEHYAREQWPHDMPDSSLFSHLEAVKFQQLIKPEEIIELQLEWKPDKHKLYFKYIGTGEDSDKQLSSGRFVYTQAQAD